MNTWLSTSYYHNTLGQWAIAFGVLVLSILVGRTLYWLSSRYLRKLAEKSDTKFDDIIIDTLEEPISVAAVLAGLKFALGILSFPETMARWTGNGWNFIVILAAAWAITRLIDALIGHYLVPLAEESENDLDDALLPIVRRSVKTVVWLLAILVGLNNAGYDIGALIAGLGIGGLAFALAAQDTVSNLFGGFTIFTDKPFGINQRVKVAGFDGNVEEIGLRSTRLRTLEGRLVTIPNSAIASAPTENVSSEPARKVVVELGLTYDTPAEGIERALELLKTIAKETEGVGEDVYVGFTEFGDFALKLLFIYFIESGADILGTQTKMNLAILRRFADANLDMAFPTQTIVMNSSAG